jgi:putative tricarboxylic transport membrane protein
MPDVSTSDSPMKEAVRSDWPALVGSVVAIGLGAAAFWAARDFSPLGAVFPRSVGLLLVILGTLHVVFFALGRTRRAAPLDGSMLRRAAVAAVMLGWGLGLGMLGFLPASAVAMAALVAIAHHGRWTARAALVFTGASGTVLLALYGLFKFALLVPLP